AFVTFLPLYLANDLEMSPRNVGFHIGLLVLVGIVATPLLGYLSDRVNRKLVLVPGMLALCFFTLLLIPYGEGVTLVILLALLGLFLYSDQPILTAAALDLVGEGVATTTLGVLSFSRFVLSAASPLIAGGLYQAKGIDGAYLYIAGTLAVAATTLLFLPIGRPAEHAPEGHHGH
ncbi:MAG: MFS transporter, partial [Chloroflexi bacterium]|nr:MFS transporter [Chloroflexota bacterium]